MSSQTARTGEENRPDCEQKWQSSGQPPVLSDTMPSTSTSGPHQRIRTSWASAQQSSSRSSGSRRTLEHLVPRRALAALQHLLAGFRQNVSHRAPLDLNGVQVTGSGVQLHKRDVVDAATTLLDTYGIADLTMRRLRPSLDVSPGALYWHFPNKQALLGAVADRILQPACRQSALASWRDRVGELGSLLRDALLSHTDGAELVSASFAAGQSAAMAEIVTQLARAAVVAKVPSEQAELAARSVVYSVLGFRLRTSNPGAVGRRRAYGGWPVDADDGSDRKIHVRVEVACRRDRARRRRHRRFAGRVQ